MNLQEQISRMKSMMGLINESMIDYVQEFVDDTLHDIRVESEEWGLGEMDDLDEIESIDKIVVNNIVNDDIPKIYVDIYKNSNRYDFDKTIASITYGIQKYIPNVIVVLNKIIDERTFGPGIDW